MKNILVITPFFYPHIGGSERYMEDLYAYIKEKNESIGIDVLCYNTNKVKSRQLYRGLNIYRIPCFNILTDQFCLPKPIPLIKFLIANRSKYDLIHVSTRFFDSSWWAPVWAKLTKTRIILTDHCASHPTSDSVFVRLVSKIIDQTIVASVLPLYEKIFVESKKTQNFLKKTFNVKSTLAYPGIDESPTSPWRHKNLPAGRQVEVLYIGRLIESKGINFLFEIAQKNPSANFIFAGSGRLLDALKKKSRGARNISMLGSVSRNEVKKLLQRADIFAYPSWHSEGLPMSLIEAAQAALGIVATDSGAISELVIDQKTGLLTAVGDSEAFKNALKRLVESQSLRKRLGKNAQEFVESNFSWGKAADLIVKELSST
ncbi:MAG: glycosyltransferase family 4 protein [Candidatus Levybacteria bacterium]|nr:glycosyltransferase family 4 protein [Candidatus Levybacteria bacterium]